MSPRGFATSLFLRPSFSQVLSGWEHDEEICGGLRQSTLENDGCQGTARHSVADSRRHSSTKVLDYAQVRVKCLVSRYESRAWCQEFRGRLFCHSCCAVVCSVFVRTDLAVAAT